MKKIDSRFRRFSLTALSFVTALGTSLAACASNDGAPPADDVQLDEVEIVHGVADKGRDPAVIAIDVGGEGLCTGTLIEADVVLTARHCVSRTKPEVTCPSQGGQIEGQREASSLRIFAGDDVATAQLIAAGREIVVPEGDTLCDADIALIVLDRAVEGIEPLAVREAGIAQGDHVRSVGYGKPKDASSSGEKLLREHVKVLETTYAEFRVGEATCQGDSGGPAIDEETGEVVGVVSRGGPSCQGKGVHNIYTRTDAFYSLIEDALSRGIVGPPEPNPDPTTELDAGKHHKHKDGGKGKRHKKDGGRHGKKQPSDMGGACKAGADCAAGVCVKDKSKQYCSRTCDAHDRCPAHFRCHKPKGGDQSVCIEK